MAHKKGGGSSRNGRDSNAQRLGVKRYGGQMVKAGEVLVRQHGTKIHAGEYVGQGTDYTLFAKAQGNVKYDVRRNRKYVSVIPVAVEAPKAEEKKAAPAKEQKQ